MSFSTLKGFALHSQQRESYSPQLRMNMGVALCISSLLIRASSAGVMVAHWRDGGLMAFAGAVYIVGKILFYVGLALAGPAAIQRYPWLRPVRWRRKKSLT